MMKWAIWLSSLIPKGIVLRSTQANSPFRLIAPIAIGAICHCFLTSILKYHGNTSSVA
jgi:hypothetical protein